MNADIYVQGVHWATIDIPPHSLLGILAQGLVTLTLRHAAQLEQDLITLDAISCSISLRVKEHLVSPTEAPG